MPFQFDLGLVQARPLRRRRFLWLSHVERPLVFAPTSGMAIGSSSRECVELGTRTGVNASASAHFPKFVLHCRTRFHELRKALANSLILVPLFYLKFLDRILVVQE
ncbi:MAG: hypothetical protein WBQ22_22885, partial [Bradyrhizobium sp.]